MNVNIDIVKKYANPSLSAYRMHQIYEGVKKGCPTETLDQLLLQDIDDLQLKDMIKILCEDNKLSCEQVLNRWVANRLSS